MKNTIFCMKTLSNTMEEVQACRACLATDVKLNDMFSYKLVQAYETLTGINVSSEHGLPHYLCVYCSFWLLKLIGFQSRCRTAQQLLHCALIQDVEITTDYIKQLDRKTNGLSQPYSCHSISYDVEEESNNELNDIFNNIIKQNDSIKIEGTTSSDEETLAELIQKSGRPSKKKNTDIITIQDYQVYDVFNDNFDDNVSIKEEIDLDNFNYHIDNDNKNLIMNDQNFDNDTENKIDLIMDEQMEVVTLSKEEQVEELKLRQNSENYKNSYFKCELCYKGFLMETTFKNHMERHNPSFGPYCCDICHIRTADKRSLQAHISSTHSKKCICRRCGHISKSVQRARDHCKWHDGVTYLCKTCGTSFSKSTSYLTHIRTRHPTGHICDLCNASFVSANGLKMHWLKAHNKKMRKMKEEKCGNCDAHFKNKMALDRHLSLAVDNNCDSAVRPCAHCGDSFDSVELLKEHTKLHHKEGPVKCIECNKEFSSSRCCANHYHRVHLQIRSNGRKKAAQNDAVCEICGLKCMSRATLVYHQRIHSGEKPYQCSECQKKFSVYQRLQIHMRTHTGERPFKCSHCPKAFMHKAALNRHDRVHSGAKPYSCPHCSKTFSQSNSMKIHVRGVHLKLPALYRRTNATSNVEK